MFLSRRYRPNKWPFYGLILLELALTVALLALFGIAAPNLYRTKLWQDGSDNGFNSSPLTGLYAAANYRPYTTPKVWSQFITNYNVVIAVLSMFIMLLKVSMYMLHVFPPILSCVVHAILIAIYTVSVYYQASSDTSDPEHPQNGPPWYITKSCSVTLNKSLVGYCMQAKAAFACTVAMLGLFVVYLGFAAWSCIPSQTQKAEYNQRRRERAEKYGKLEASNNGFQGEPGSYPTPQTPGIQSGLNPMTPRTLAFNTLGGTKDLPLRTHFSSPNAHTSPSFASTSFAIRSPDLPRSPMSPGFDHTGAAASSTSRREEAAASPPAAPNMYFPPPPKSSTKK